MENHFSINVRAYLLAILFHWSIYLTLCHYYTFLMIQLCIVLKLRGVTLPTLLFFLKIVLAIRHVVLLTEERTLANLDAQEIKSILK